MNTRPARFTELVPGQPVLYSETLSQKSQGGEKKEQEGEEEEEEELRIFTTTPQVTPGKVMLSDRGQTQQSCHRSFLYDMSKVGKSLVFNFTEKQLGNQWLFMTLWVQPKLSDCISPSNSMRYMSHIFVDLKITTLHLKNTSIQRR